MTIFILIVIYVISVYLNYRWVKRAYSKASDTTKEGIYANLDVDSASVIGTFLPVLNTLTAIIFFTESPYKYQSAKDSSTQLNKFFGVKK